MNQKWSEKNKKMQQLLQKATFAEGITELLELRNLLMEEMLSWKNKLSREDYNAIPFINSDGYHSKTVAYSIWHIIRIEDIVVNTLIRNKEEVFFAGGYQQKMNAPIVTTGNELVKEEIAVFSAMLNLDVLYQYAHNVFAETNLWLSSLTYSDLKRKFGDGDREQLQTLGVVSTAESAAWLIDYWCSKDVKGLLKMPLSRHWIMHIEAANRILIRIGK